MPEPFRATDLAALAAGAGFPVNAVITISRLVRILDRAPLFRSTRAGTEVLLPALREVLPPGLGAFLAVALPYAVGEPDDPGLPGDPCGLVARFARRNYYRAAVLRLREIVKVLRARTGLGKSDFRIFVNSRIPEKLIAFGAGLGAYGKNKLLYNKVCGSRFVIGLLFLPFAVEEENEATIPPDPDGLCGACTACLSACPTGALDAPAENTGLPRCLKARSDTLESWDDQTKERWGQRFYGCDTCQDVCPLNKGKSPGERPSVGEVGSGVSLSAVLSMSEDELKNHFKKTALGLSWILPRALLRNALVAAGNAGERNLLGLVEGYADHPEPAVADAARWAVKKITG